MLVRQAISQLASSYTEDQILRYFGFLFSHVMSSSTVQTLFCSKQMLVAPESCTVVCVCGGGGHPTPNPKEAPWLASVSDFRMFILKAQLFETGWSLYPFAGSHALLVLLLTRGSGRLPSSQVNLPSM